MGVPKEPDAGSFCPAMAEQRSHVALPECCPVDFTGPPLVRLVQPVDHDGQQGGSAGLPCRGPAFPGLRIEQGRRRRSSSAASRWSATRSP
jgi:hypothetical protein